MSATTTSDRFVHLHLHTQYSLLDGANKIPDVLARAHALGQPAIAMTDHGNLHGAVDFFKEGKGIGIKPLIGSELYLSTTSRTDRTSKTQGGGATHLTVLVMNRAGFKNLSRLTTLSYTEGFYFKPRIDKALLAECNEGLLILSGCLGGELAELIAEDQEVKARELCQWYATTFGDRFYLEVQPHPIPEQQRHNEVIRHFATTLGIPLVATTDCHYLSADDHHAQEVLMCISTQKQITDPTRLKHDGVRLHLKTRAEMEAEFAGQGIPAEALDTSLTIAERCQFDFDFKTYYMPKYEPENDTRPLIEIMAEKARYGLEKRFDVLRSRPQGLAAGDRQVYTERLELEITLIEKMGFAGYFLIVSDFIVWAKEHGVPVGPGRGSCAGSLVAYAMRITEVDPIEHKLLFERFLNPERISLPDIDVDFCINGRERVIHYVSQKYGRDKVAQIATFGTLKAKAAIKDVGRALGMSFAETDKIAQLIPAPRQGFDYSIKEAIEMEPKLKAYAEGEGRELIELAQKLEGLTRHSSTHAAGVVIGDRPLVELLPLMVDKDEKVVTQFDMTAVEKIGLVKFDFLGLKTLTVIHTALSLIKGSRGIDVVLETLPLNDAKTFALLCSGNTTGVFQLESSGITEMTVRLKPNCFDDLVATIALYRPGPLDAGMVDHYINRKHGREPVTYLHPLMERVLSDTYGIMLYQEQIMQLARELAGYSLAEADLLRKAMGKKIPEEMAKQRARFVSGSKERGLSDAIANEIFNQMETFARYGFNRSHSAAYAMISYHTAYLKAHYPQEFLAALLTLDAEDSDKVLKNITECRTHQIAVLPPSINESLSSFSVVEGKIRFGLGAIKGIGEKAIASILRAREAGSFKDLEDLLERIDLEAINRRVVESLILSGACDGFGVSRREMFESVEELLKAAQTLHRDAASGQVSLFAPRGKATIPRRRRELPEWPVNQRLAHEREALGFYISGHPLEKFKGELKRLGVGTIAAAKTVQGKRENVVLAGVVTVLKLKNTKKGDRYATFALEDASGTVETIVWPSTYQSVETILAADDPVVIKGRLEISDERTSFVADSIESLTALRDARATRGVVVLRDSDARRQVLDSLHQMFRRHTGSCPVSIVVRLPEGEAVIKMPPDAVKVTPSERLCEEVEQLLGRPALSFV